MKSMGMKARTAPSALTGQRNTSQINAAPASGMSSSVSFGTKINKDTASRRASTALLTRKADANGFSSDWSFTDSNGQEHRVPIYWFVLSIFKSNIPLNQHQTWTRRRRADADEST